MPLNSGHNSRVMRWPKFQFQLHTFPPSHNSICMAQRSEPEAVPVDGVLTLRLVAHTDRGDRTLHGDLRVSGSMKVTQGDAWQGSAASQGGQRPLTLIAVEVDNIRAVPAPEAASSGAVHVPKAVPAPEAVPVPEAARVPEAGRVPEALTAVPEAAPEAAVHVPKAVPAPEAVPVPEAARVPEAGRVPEAVTAVPEAAPEAGPAREPEVGVHFRDLNFDSARGLDMMLNGGLSSEECPPLPVDENRPAAVGGAYGGTSPEPSIGRAIFVPDSPEPADEVTRQSDSLAGVAAASMTNPYTNTKRTLTNPYMPNGQRPRSSEVTLPQSEADPFSEQIIVDVRSLLGQLTQPA